MKVINILLEPYDITQEERKEINTVVVPEGSVFLRVLALMNGIYVFYQVPEIDTGQVREDKFATIGQNGSVPEGFDEYVDVLAVPAQTADGEQALMLIPIYKKPHAKVQSLIVS